MPPKDEVLLRRGSLPFEQQMPHPIMWIPGGRSTMFQDTVRFNGPIPLTLPVAPPFPSGETLKMP
jgi:hypothetical protein